VQFCRFLAFPDFRFSLFFSYLPFAFRPMVVRIARSSTDSASRALILAGAPIPESPQISSQYPVSDASFFGEADFVDEVCL